MNVFVWFWWLLKMTLGLFPPLKSLRKISVSFSLYAWWNSPVKPSGLGPLFAGSIFYYRFCFISSAPSVQIIYFFLIEFWWTVCSWNSSISSRLVEKLYWHIVVHSILMDFCISVLLVVISPLSFLVLFVMLGQRFVDFCLPLQRNCSC